MINNKRYDLIIDNEFLIAVANNSMRMNTLINDLIDDVKELKVLSESEIEEVLLYNLFFLHKSIY